MLTVEKFRTKGNIKDQLEEYLSNHTDLFIVNITPLDEEGDEAVVVVFNDDPGYANTMVMEEGGVGIDLEG